jgi:hypothetical protein
MDITLVYRKDLPAAQNNDKRTLEKHRMRLLFSEQLRRVWEENPILYVARGGNCADGTFDGYRVTDVVRERQFGQCRVKGVWCAFTAWPLVMHFNGLTCHVDITLASRKAPGSIVNDGDLDNRLKIIFDALRLPRGPKEVPGSFNEEAELFTLLEDDSLISKVSIEWERLLTPQEPSEPENYVELRIKATTKILRAHPGTISGYA